MPVQEKSPPPFEAQGRRSAEDMPPFGEWRSQVTQSKFNGEEVERGSAGPPSAGRLSSHLLKPPTWKLDTWGTQVYVWATGPLISVRLRCNYGFSCIPIQLKIKDSAQRFVCFINQSEDCSMNKPRSGKHWEADAKFRISCGTSARNLRKGDSREIRYRNHRPKPKSGTCKRP